MMNPNDNYVQYWSDNSVAFTCFTTWEALCVMRYSAASMALRIFVTLTWKDHLNIRQFTSKLDDLHWRHSSVSSPAGRWTSSAAAWCSGSVHSVSEHKALANKHASPWSLKSGPLQVRHDSNNTAITNTHTHTGTVLPSDGSLPALWHISVTI